LERIVETALAIVDHDGPDALSLRGLAERLSSSTAMLYRHVSNKSELVGLVIERALAEVDLPEPDDEQPWDAVCRSTMYAVYATLTRHRSLAPLLMERFPNGPHAAAIRERILHALLRSGFAPDTAASAVATLARYTLGFAMQSGTPQQEHQPAQVSGPGTAAVAHLLPKPLTDEFEFGLTLMLEGLRSMHPANGYRG
jgi:AcrR family transcriptional regulator